MVAELGHAVWERHTLIEIVAYLSLLSPIDLNSEKGFALKEVEEVGRGLRPEKLALISSGSRGQRLRLLSAIVYSCGARVGEGAAGDTARVVGIGH